MSAFVAMYDFCISDPLTIDLEVFNFWLDGLSVEDAADQLLYLQESDDLLQRVDATRHDPQVHSREWQQLVTSDAGSQFRTFRMLKPYLDDPTRWADQRFRMPAVVRQRVLDAYYSFDDRLMREALGRKPTPKLRRALEAQCERLNISLTSCRRQADNLYRLYMAADEHEPHVAAAAMDERAAEDSFAELADSDIGLGHSSRADGEGEAARGSGRSEASGAVPALLGAIQGGFMISERLAIRYARLLFLCAHQFETHVGQLQLLRLEQWESLAAVILCAWTAPGSGWDLNPQLTIGLREIKVHLLDQKVFSSMQSAAMSALGTSFISSPQVSSRDGYGRRSSTPTNTKAIMTRVSARLHQLIKLLLELGGALSYAKELRDLFVDLMEVLEVLKQIGLSEAESQQLLDIISKVYAPISQKQLHAKCWSRFLYGVRKCIALL